MSTNNARSPVRREERSAPGRAAQRAGASHEWLAKVTQDLALSSAGVTARFTPAGVEIGNWLYTFEEPASEVTVPRRVGNRVTYSRAGGITEWYEAKEGGIEQGFTVTQMPALVEGLPGDLVVLGRVNGPHDAQMGEGEMAFGALRYSQLKAWDATGRELEAAMEWDTDSHELALRIPSTALVDAAFPVTIDPLLSTPAWAADPTDQTSATFGYSVASAGDVNDDGFADVLVGARLWDGAATNEGRAFLYLGSATGLAATPSWTADPTDQAGANFGSSVSGAGDVNGDGFADALVGAYGWNGTAAVEGRAYLYLGSATGLAATPSWTADPTDQAGASFGYSVSAAGDVNGDGFADVLVGAPYWDGAVTDEGRAYLYLGSATGLAATPSWTADPTDQAGAYFGWSVSGTGDVNGDGFADVLVGAAYWDEAGLNEGRTYLYLGSATGLATTPAWTADPTDQAGTHFGYSVSGAGDVNGDGFADVLVGAPDWEGAATDEGRAYAYLGSATGLASPVWTADPTDQAGVFGRSVSGAGDINGDGFADVLVGAPQWNGAATGEGRAYLYLGSATGLAATPAWTADPTDQTGASFGFSVSGAGDVNGDGFADVIVGAYEWGDTAAYEGRAYLYLGSATGLAATPAWTADPTDQAGASFGISVSGAGDVNGDGFADVLVGAFRWDGEGRAYLYLGNATGLAATPAWTADPTDQTGALFGFSVSGTGDVNGDGFADVVVGAYGWNGAAAAEGRAYLYLGGASGLASTPAWTADPTDQANASFGESVSGAGDVNGDGFADVLVGAYAWNGAAAAEGRAYLYLGSASGLAATPSWTADATDQANAFFGISVSGAGDVNGDGFADVLVGARAWNGAANDEGRADLYLGSATGLAATPAWTADPTDQPNGSFGASVSGAGDVNGDGFADALIGAYGWGSEGRTYLYLGGDVGLPGLNRRLGQFQSNGTTLIGLGNSAGGATVVLKERVTQEGPVGAALRLQVEVKPVGVLFNGLGTVVSAPVLAGQTASATVSGLRAGAYRWRSRVVYPVKTGQGRWVSYGRNSEADVDFRVLSAPDGSVCTSAAQCASGNCVDGVCCNTACSGACDACNLAPLVGTCTNAPAGSAGAPSCTPYVCSGSAATCPTGCFLGDAGCATGSICAAGLCVANLDAGGPDGGDAVDAGSPDGGDAVDAGGPDGGDAVDAGGPDGGDAVDAGDPDGGAAVDAGDLDAGGDRLERRYAVGCGCGSTPSGGLLGGLLLVGLARRCRAKRDRWGLR